MKKIYIQWDNLTKRIRKYNSPEKLRKIKIIGYLPEKEYRGLKKWEK